MAGACKKKQTKKAIDRTKLNPLLLSILSMTWQAVFRQQGFQLGWGFWLKLYFLLDERHLAGITAEFVFVHCEDCSLSALTPWFTLPNSQPTPVCCLMGFDINIRWPWVCGLLTWESFLWLPYCYIHVWFRHFPWELCLEYCCLLVCVRALLGWCVLLCYCLT